MIQLESVEVNGCLKKLATARVDPSRRQGRSHERAPFRLPGHKTEQEIGTNTKKKEKITKIKTVAARAPG